MKIEKIVVGPLQENCYILKKNNDIIIVDPGDEYEKIKNKIKNYNLICILITHAHFDHIGALNDFFNDYNIPIYYFNKNNEINYKNLINLQEQEYKIKNFKFKTIYTPGHRNDEMTFYFYEEKMMFTGDFLFKGTIGRTDLEYGNSPDMQESIKKIKQYEDNIEIYPGHGDNSTLGLEKENNIFF